MALSHLIEVKKMRKISYKFLFIVGLITVLGLGTIVSAYDGKSKETKDEVTRIPKNMSMVSVTTDEPMTVYVDGVAVGKTQGNQVKFEYPVNPGNHEVKIVNDGGKEFVKTDNYVKGVRNCICVKTVRKKIETPCPYDIQVSGPEKVQEGDLITFAAMNAVSGGANPLNYVWRVSPSNARVTSGLGTPSITVDSTGLGGQAVRAEVEVTDGYYDAQCRQRIAVNTPVEKLPPPVQPPYEEFDRIVFRVFDDDKARLDNYAVALQNKPDAQGYMIVYQGPKVKNKVVDANKMARRSLDYLVKVRGIDPRRIIVIQGGTREQTMADLFFVYSNGTIPVPTPR